MYHTLFSSSVTKVVPRHQLGHILIRNVAIFIQQLNVKSRHLYNTWLYKGRHLDFEER